MKKISKTMKDFELKSLTKEKKPATIQEITAETMEAFGDCWSEDEQHFENRKLEFRASGSLKPDDWYKLMKKAVPNGYNNFDTEKVYQAVKNMDIRIVPAREGSVCLYIIHFEKAYKLRKIFFQLEADEIDSIGGELRIWWD